jgi:hypothetical protein
MEVLYTFLAVAGAVAAAIGLGVALHWLCQREEREYDENH